ncbi:HsdM family class I SAM-dependent methyltransferase [Georgenia yuyongxinii]
MSEKDGLGAIVQALREVGYSLIQREPALRGNNTRFRPDILAWASNRDGELVPWAVVEVKQTRAPLPPPGATLDVLAQAREQLGTTEHYAVINGQWFKATSGLIDLEPVGGPQPPRFGSDGEIIDVTLATSLLREQLWRETDLARNAGHRVDYFVPKNDLFTPEGIASPFGGLLPVRPDVLFTASRKALIELGSRGREMGLFTSHPGVARAVARLAGPKLGSDVCDPFCGTGSFLWAAIDEGLERGHPIRSAFGLDLNRQMVDLARSIADVAPSPTDIQLGDAFVAPVPMSSVVVSAPPLGIRLSEPHTLIDGEATRDIDFAAIDLAVRSLEDGGRAVVQVAPGFTFKRQGERYRRMLALDFRVGALIGLPAGSVPGTNVGSVLVVIDRATPRHDTFVAQLGEDWETQLAPGGAALAAATAHLESLESGV